MRRLIPAHAGKTAKRIHLSAPRQAHPRACGENGFRRRFVTSHPGSSPRMRGKLSSIAGAIRVHRLIPAHAGKTP